MTRRFTIIAVGLIIIILIGVIMTISAIDSSISLGSGGIYYYSHSTVFGTNSSVGTFIAQTITAKAYTDTPTPTPPHQDSF